MLSGGSVAETETPLVACDAGPIIHLDELSALDLLGEFAAVLVPEAVWLEVSRHRPEAFQREQASLQRVTVEQEEDPAFDALAQALSLGAGERQAIQLARQRSGAFLLTDDAAARLVAESLGLQVHGTLGILIRAARRNQRKPAEVLALLESLPDNSTLHLRADFLAKVIQQFKDAYGL